jgi:thiamine-phosphate pyrophosphorylase
MKSLRDCLLYGILDLGYVTAENLGSMTHLLIQGGVDLIQLRAKEVSKSEIIRLSRIALSITQPVEIPLIINDYPELLRNVDAQGCHVGQDDYSVQEARTLAGRPCIVGKSTHSLEQAINAAAQNADYIGFGPLFATPTKPGRNPIGLSSVAEVHTQVSIPIFCIGGIKVDNLPNVQQAGAKRVCVVSDFLCAPDVPGQVAKAKTLLKNFARSDP